MDAGDMVCKHSQNGTSAGFALPSVEFWPRHRETIDFGNNRNRKDLECAVRWIYWKGIRETWITC